MRRQQFLLDGQFKMRLDHGGSLSVGKRKTIRPIDPKRALHVVFRASRASFPRKRETVLRVLEATKKRFGISVYRNAINSNHLHLVIRGRTRRDIQGFLRTFAGVLARAMTGASRASAHGRFWDLPVWSRIVEWGKAYRGAIGYVQQNILEAAGVIPYKPRATTAHTRKRKSVVT